MKRFLLVRAGETLPVCHTYADSKLQAVRDFLRDGAPIDGNGDGRDSAGNRLFVAEDFNAFLNPEK
jgi:hypothetical protein